MVCVTYTFHSPNSLAVSLRENLTNFTCHSYLNKVGKKNSQLPPTRPLALNALDSCLSMPRPLCLEQERGSFLRLEHFSPNALCPAYSYLSFTFLPKYHLLQEAFLASPPRRACTSLILGNPFPQTMTENSESRDQVCLTCFPAWFLVSSPNN